jgi:beta-glucosidase
MCSYNKVNGAWACENKSILVTDLRERLGFEGFVMSDWGATHSVDDIEKGLDQDMSFGNDIWNQDSLQDVPVEELDESVYHILKSMMTVGIFDEVNPNGDIDAVVTNDEHKKIARQINEESIVLLKNENHALPLDISKTQNILVLGEDDLAYYARSHGTGSGAVHNTFVQPPIHEFCDRLGINRFGDIYWPRRQCHEFRGHCITYGGSKQSHPFLIPSSLYDTTVIFIGGVMAGEDHDRPSLGFTKSLNSMITSFAQSNRKQGKKTIVVMSIPGVVEFPWADEVDAIIADFYGGEQMAPALLNVIYGDVNPSGKLPVTL